MSEKIIRLAIHNDLLPFEVGVAPEVIIDGKPNCAIPPLFFSDYYPGLTEEFMISGALDHILLNLNKNAWVIFSPDSPFWDNLEQGAKL